MYNSTDVWLSSQSVRLVLCKLGLDSMAESDQKTFKIWYASLLDVSI